MSRLLGIYKKISLADSVPGWDDCYLIFKPFRFEHLDTIIKYFDADKKDPASQDESVSITESKSAMAKELARVLEELFIEGKVKDIDGTTIDAEAGDIPDLFLACAQVIMNGMYGILDPKSPRESTTSSSTTPTQKTTR